MLFDKSSISKTHYDILSVKEDAIYEEIRASYRSAILNSHPDKLQGISNTPNSAHEKTQENFLEVQKAWEILSDSWSRAVYDSELHALRQDSLTAEDVRLDEMMVEDVGEILELFYQCRCGDYFSVDSTELEEMGYSLNKGEGNVFLRRIDALPASVLLPCGSCSLKIRLMINVDSSFSS